MKSPDGTYPVPKKFDIYFVLNKLVNGQDGEFSITALGKQQPDGWYWLHDGMTDGVGPFRSKQAAAKAGRISVNKNDKDDDEIDLSKATLFCSNASGVYIPQRFAQEVDRSCVTGVADKDYEVLEAGPDHEHYWDAWADVLDNAKIQDPKMGECYLYQEGDLWVVPVQKEEPPPILEPKIVLGHKFYPMTQNDWYGYAGAVEGTLICHLDNVDLLLDPNGQVHEHIHDEAFKPNGCKANVWTCENILEG